ncbi:MAG: aminoacyl-tRNA hydrolase [Ignavibacteriales bacterium]|nr:aminoacyl-tRNA hydrolase [Ignavibacteriales bacterium]
MRAIFGIGNPGSAYSETRHNVGFMILDKFAELNKLKFRTSKFKYYYAEGSISASPFFLIKPTTYVNLSGEAALSFVEKHKIDIQDLLVVCDDVNFSEGEVRLKITGGDAGHKGLKSIIYHLQSNQFPRIRFGVGSNFESGNLSEYVLDKFENNTFDLIENSIKFAVVLIEKFILYGTKGMLDYYSDHTQKNVRQL